MRFYKTESPEYRAFEQRIPQLEPGDVEKINRLFPAFIFRRRKTQELWTTCCRKHIELGKSRTVTGEMRWIMDHEMHTPEPIESMYWKKPKNWPECDRTAACPICGAKAKVKDVGKCGEMKNLYRYRRPVIWKAREDGLWAICYNAEKGYAKDKDLTREPFIEEIAAYRFHAGKVQHRERNYWVNGYTGMTETEKPEGKRHWVDSPYTGSKEYGRGYDEINKAEAIAGSAYRYCQLDRVASDSIRTAAVACWYPRQVEMLIKLGLGEAVERMADGNEKNSSVIHWESNQPKDLLGMDYKAAKEIADRGGLDLLKTLKRMPGVRMDDAEQFARYVMPKQQLRIKALAKKYGHELKDVARYLADMERNETKKKTKQNLLGLGMLFCDYIKSAEGIGYDLRNPLIMMPRYLIEKHDEAADAYRELLRERKELEDQQKAWDEIPSLSKREKLSGVKAIRAYILKMRDEGQYHRRETQRYFAYINLAREMGENVEDPEVQFPDNFIEAEKELMKRKGVKLKAEEEEKERMYAESISMRARRYEFAYNGMMIIMPRTMMEIINEGKALRHCVAGYAERHMKNILTILFLRRESDPETPLVTIEMNGKAMVQIHGYRNEMEPCEENPCRVRPRELYAEFLDVWQRWLKSGSQRNEDGSPKLPRRLKGDKKNAGTKCNGAA